MTSTGSGDIRQIVTELVANRSRTQRQDVDDGVAAVITVEEDLRFLPATLHAVLAQSVLPSTVVVADCAGRIDQPMQLTFYLDSRQLASDADVSTPPAVMVLLVPVKGARSFSDAVAKAVRHAILNSSVRSLWMLHDDSRPANETCLEMLLEARRNAQTASLIGAKQLDWDGIALHDVGAYTRKHRIESLVVDGEPDQEQYEWRQDVFAVSLAGALVPLDTLNSLRGVNPWFGTYAESEDFSRRVCLSGGRVIVVPRAAIAHRRARFEGIRSRAGEPLDEERPQRTTMQRLLARQRYYYTDMNMSWWPLVWIISLLCSFANAAVQLFAKRPYDAWCELRLPWLWLTVIPGAIRARRKVSRQSVMPLSRISALVADRRQMAQWHDRGKALQSQWDTVLLSPLERSHLHRRAIRRWSGAVLMALVAFGAVVWVHWDLFRAVIGGAGLYSSQLLATGASFSQLASAATTPWAFGVGTGVAAPPMPWLLVWLVTSVFTVGHTGVAVALMFFLAAPLSAFSFWALAGVFTRSDAVRIVCGVLWVALSAAMGLYRTADLAMLTVMVFLPIAFAFVFRAVGMYHTEDRVRPHSSVQAAACAALCFMPLLAAQPQLVFPFIVLFLVFVVFVRRHRLMLLLMPIPAAIIIAPTIVNAIRYAREGMWRQLFGDIATPTATLNGSPSSLSFIDVIVRAFGLQPHGGPLFATIVGDPASAAVAVMLLIVVILAVASLFLPFALRVSRLMWVVAVAGALLGMVSARVAIAVDQDGAVAGSVLPGVALAMLGLMSCVCLVAGGAVKRFVPLRLSGSGTVLGSTAAADTVRRIAIRVGRSLLVVVVAAGTCIWFGFGVTRGGTGSVSPSTGGLPMVAVDYLAKRPEMRILALHAESRTVVDFSSLRTGKGDLVDSSAAERAQRVSGITHSADQALADSSARLLAEADSGAISAIGKLGFAGIYVTYGSGDSVQRAASQRLATNITASDGVQTVASDNAGSYYRLTAANASIPVIDIVRQHAAQSSGWRFAWLWCAGVVTALYCLVAIPRGRRNELEAEHER